MPRRLELIVTRSQGVGSLPWLSISHETAKHGQAEACLIWDASIVPWANFLSQTGRLYVERLYGLLDLPVPNYMISGLIKDNPNSTPG